MILFEGEVFKNLFFIKNLTCLFDLYFLHAGLRGEKARKNVILTLITLALTLNTLTALTLALTLTLTSLT